MSRIYVGIRTVDAPLPGVLRAYDSGVALVLRIDPNPRGPDRVSSLPWALDIVQHSPTGLEWGYSGSGCVQLAAALLNDALLDVATGRDEDAATRASEGRKDRVIAAHRAFCGLVVEGLPRDRQWQLTAGEVLAMLAQIEAGAFRSGAHK